MPKTVSRAYLEHKLMEEAGLSKVQAFRAVNLIFSEIEDAVIDGGTAEIRGFGKFSLCEMKERDQVNPATGEIMRIPVQKRPKFRPSATWKKKCNEAG